MLWMIEMKRETIQFLSKLIRRKISMARYKEIADEVRRRILDGEYPAESLIPDQNSLADEFEVSRMTIKKALDIIATEGLIYRQRGSGTYVMKTALLGNKDGYLQDYEGLTKQMQGKTIQSKVISFDIEFPDDELASMLMIETNSPVYKIVRQRVVQENELKILEYTYFVAELIPGLSEEHAEKSIYNYIQNELELGFGGAFRKIHADKSDELDHKYLDCAEHDPVLEVEQVVYLKNGKPFEYSRSRNRFDTRSYTMVDVQRDN